MNELKEKIKDLQKQMYDICSLLEELENKLEVSTASDEIPEVPTFNDEDMWYLSDTNKIVHSHANLREGEWIAGEWVPGDFNIFHSEDFAKEYQRRIREIGALLHCKWYLDRNYVPDWDDGDRQKWTVVYNYNEGKFTIEFSRMREWSVVYFDTEASAQKAADWMNAHKELFE